MPRASMARIALDIESLSVAPIACAVLGANQSMLVGEAGADGDRAALPAGTSDSNALRVCYCHSLTYCAVGRFEAVAIFRKKPISPQIAMPDAPASIAGRTCSAQNSSIGIAL